MNYIIAACFPTGTPIHFLRFILFNCDLFNYMLLCFFPLALICFPQCMLHVLAAHNVLGLSRCLWSLTYALKALSWKSFWIKASAKWINVGLPNYVLYTIELHQNFAFVSTELLYLLGTQIPINRQAWFHLLKGKQKEVRPETNMIGVPYLQRQHSQAWAPQEQWLGLIAKHTTQQVLVWAGNNTKGKG